MNIRYFIYPDEAPNIQYYYSLDSETGLTGVAIYYDGEIDSEGVDHKFIVPYFREVFTKPGISPDPGPIEERYINATDRPSVEGFKYPELHPVNDVES